MAVRVPEAICPACGARRDAATLATDIEADDMPEPGNLSVCVACSSFLRFTDDLQLALLSPAELRALSAEDRNDLWAMRRLVHKLPAELRR